MAGLAPPVSPTDAEILLNKYYQQELDAKSSILSKLSKVEIERHATEKQMQLSNCIESLNRLHQIVNSKISDLRSRIDRDSEESKQLSNLEQLWLPNARIDFKAFLSMGVEKGMWDNEYRIVLQRGALYGAGKSFLGALFLVLKGMCLSKSMNHNVAGKAFCDFFDIDIDPNTADPYKSFQSANRSHIKELQRAFNLS